MRVRLVIFNNPLAERKVIHRYRVAPDDQSTDQTGTVHKNGYPLFLAYWHLSRPRCETYLPATGSGHR